MSAKHTPGPWSVELGAKIYVRCNIGRDTGGSGFAVAACLKSFGPDESKANARLIAAAPELLEALKALLECSDEPGSPQHNERTRAARAAIAMAEGQS